MDILIKSRKTVLAITFHREKEQNQNIEYTLFFTSAYHLETNRKKTSFLSTEVWFLKFFFWFPGFLWEPDKGYELWIILSYNLIDS